MEVYAPADDVERGFHIPSCEDIEEARGILRMRAVIECEGDVIAGNCDAAEGDAGRFREVAGMSSRVVTEGISGNVWCVVAVVGGGFERGCVV